MTGLNLESFLHLMRADLGAWATVALIVGMLALMAWTSWGSRKALRKCLALSIIAHAGIGLYGGTVPVVLQSLKKEDAETPHRIRQIKVTPRTEPGDGTPGAPAGRGGKGGSLAPWDKTSTGLALADLALSAPRLDAPQEAIVRPGEREPIAPEPATPEANPPAPSSPEAREAKPNSAELMPGTIAPAADEIAAPVVLAAEAIGVTSPIDARITPSRPRAAAEPTAPRRAPSSEIPGLPNAPTPLPPATANGPTIEPPTALALNGNAEELPPASASVVGDRDVATADVVPARPDAPRLSVGEANLRSRARPGNGDGDGPGSADSPGARSPLAMAIAAPTLPQPFPGSATLSSRPAPANPSAITGVLGIVPPLTAATPEPDEVPRAVVARPEPSPLPRVSAPDVDMRRLTRPDSPAAVAAPAIDPARRPAPASSLALNRVTPSGIPALPEIRGAMGSRPLSDVPEVYRSRLDPNRSALAFRAGASPASEQAVERALDWLARHQDSDGRWDASTARYDDGTTVKGDDDYTVHCPPGELCFGECIYWEADTALTGLSLLAYLGAGYTQTDGKYAETVRRGLEFLILSQKPDGDLRGKSRAVGMYCHAMATIAICEAYALTGDEKLREPVEKAVAFIATARARDGLAWRYAPGSPVGDTSILGWVVMALKSAREVGIAVPSQLQTGTVGWLNKVASGDSAGLARYQPWETVTPTMTAEAWVCRQFLGVGGPGAASAEAAKFLLSHGPTTEKFNLYYLYYGTLAMYQHGGDAWIQWNSQARDEIVRRQRPGGHAGGSWDPDESPYGAKGGRVYCTALATLSLEVYYRYLRLYDDPKLPPAMAPRNRDATRALGRGGTGSPSAR